MYHKKLKDFFDNKDLSQKRVGEILGYSPAMIGRYLKGTDNINAKFIIKMVKEFPDVDLQYIFSEKENINENMLEEPRESYGLTAMDIDEELEIIITKAEKVREYLAQKRHNK